MSSVVERLSREPAAQVVHSLVPQLGDGDLRVLQRQLSEQKSAAAKELKSAVLDHHATFVLLSREIASLDSQLASVRTDLLTLRSVCDPLFGTSTSTTTSTTTSAVIATSTTSATASGAAVTSSVGVDVKRSGDLFSQSLAAFAPQIDGIDKVLADVKDPSIVKQDTRWVEINPNQTRLVKHLQLYLLHDTLVVAAQKQRHYSKKWYVDKVWKLVDLNVADVKDSPPDVFNAVRLTYGGDSFLYRADSSESKLSWLGMLKRLTDQAAQSKRDSAFPSHSKSTEVKDTAENVSVLNIPENVLASLNDLSKMAYVPSKLRSTFGKEELSNPDLAWLRDMPEELDVFIAHREFDQAVQCVDRARTILTTYTAAGGVQAQRLAPYNHQLEARVHLLAKHLCSQLSHPFLSKSQIRTNIQRLHRLGLGEQARDIFLASRSAIIRQKIKQLSFDGSAVQYITELSCVVFTLLRHTCEWYRNNFPDHRMASSFVMWVKQEVEHYAALFRRQVFHDAQPFETINQCLLIMSQQAETVAAAGLDLASVVDQSLFRKDIAQAIELYKTRAWSIISKSTADDDFQTLCGVDVKHKFAPSSTDDSPDHGSEVVLVKPSLVSTSGSVLVEQIEKMVKDLSPLLTVSLYPEIVDTFTTLLQQYLKYLLSFIRDASLSDQQHLNVLVTISYLVDTFVPAIHSFLSSPQALDHDIPELSRVLTKLSATRTVLLQTFSQRRANDLFSEGGPFQSAKQWDNDTYPVSDTIGPTEVVVKVLKSLHGLAIECGELQAQFEKKRMKPPIDTTEIIGSIIEVYMDELAEDSHWDVNGMDRVFGYTGVHQFILDMHLLLRICDPYITPRTTETANELCGRALRVYLKRATQRDVHHVMRQGEWFDKRVEEAIVKGGPEVRSFGRAAGVK